VEKERVVSGRFITAGDVLVGVPSSGLHTNGYSLARRIVFERLQLRVDSHVPELGRTVGEAFLEPHRSYLSMVRPILDYGSIKGMAHITGGGITENLPRVLPEGLHAEVDTTAWDVPALFTWLQRTGDVPAADMRRSFNMGIGLVIVCSAGDGGRLLGALREAGEADARVIGRVGAGGEGVRYVNG
jgi:phosphoribosylformylglycinamidine cyclo-ligase